MLKAKSRVGIFLEPCFWGLLGRFKLKETDFVDFITKIHISSYVNPIFMFFMSKNLQYSIVLE